MRGLVDRAQRVYRVASGTRDAQGETPFTTRLGSSFPARLSPPSSSETGGPGEASHITDTATLLCGMEAADIGPGDNVVVYSKELGTAEWTVVGSPDPLRRRKYMLGYNVSLRKVRDV